MQSVLAEDFGLMATRAQQRRPRQVFLTDATQPSALRQAQDQDRDPG
jgi:hypothetical protein